MVQEKDIVRLGLTIIMFIALLGLVSTPALAKGNGRHAQKGLQPDRVVGLPRLPI